jgi:hypothetical protein
MPRYLIVNADDFGQTAGINTGAITPAALAGSLRNLCEGWTELSCHPASDFEEQPCGSSS